MIAAKVYSGAECTYSLQEVLSVFKCYFAAYEQYRGAAHPRINGRQIEAIIEEMPYTKADANGGEGIIELSPEDYARMIPKHFNTNYWRCDYNINHFFAGRVRELRYYETRY